MSAAETLTVELGERAYDIVIGDSLLAAAGRRIAPLADGRKVFIVTDRNVAELHLATLERALRDCNVAFECFVLPAGEQTKDFHHLEHLIDRLLDAGVERRSLLIALGGGVIGDLTGFAAAVVLRGIGFVQVPTTLLAQVDSSVGGKTGIDTAHGKNLVGSFHQPRLVLIDTTTLDTLPRRELLAGYAEAVKYGLINQADFFTWLEDHGPLVVEGDPASRAKVIHRSCATKADIVATDEREAGPRALLNLGHTFAHAMEAEVGFSDELLHGEAVAIGMVLAFDLSVQLGLCPAADAARIRRHFGAMGLPTSPDAVQGRIWTAETLLRHMYKDKKVQDGRITFVLTRGIGQAFLSSEVEPGQVIALLNNALAA